MRKLLSFIACVLTSITMQGHSFEVDGIFYNILSTTSEDPTLKVEVTYEGSSYSAYDEYSGTVVIPETVEYDGNTYTVTQIGNSAFRDCKNLKSITISRNVTKVNSSAFSSCTSLTSASLPAATSIGSEAFWSCTSLTSASLPAVTSIGSSAFYNCSNITSLRIGSVEQWCGVQLEGSYASPLYNSSQNVDLYIGDSETPATNIEVPSTVTEIPQYAFNRTTITSVSAPAATYIGSYAFARCELLEEVTLPKVKSMGDEVFSGPSQHYHSSLKYVDLSSLTVVNDNAFSHCELLESINIPAATSIGNHAFYGCYSLSAIDIPEATSVGSCAFQGCESLERAIMPKVESIANHAFGGYSQLGGDGDHRRFCYLLAELDLSSIKAISPDAFQECINISKVRIGSIDQWCSAESVSNPLCRTEKEVNLYIGDAVTPTTSIEVPSTVTKIPADAFRRTTITSVSAPAATSIGSSAFDNCTSLTSASIPAATSIGNSAFGNCASLTSASFPVATSIGNNAFYNCTSLTSASLPAATSIGSYAFYNCTSLTSASIPVVTSIGRSAFQSCTSLTSASLPAATSIDVAAFHSCTSMTSISLPAAISIGNSAFYGCSNISSLRIGSVGQWCGVNFVGGCYSTPLENSSKSVDLYIGDSEIPATSIDVPSTVTKIPDCAFYNTTITSVSAPTVTSIGSRAFYDCTSLTSAGLPSATSIGSSAFYNCSKLKSLSIPKVETIGSQAFYYTAIDTLRIGSVEQYCSIEYGQTNVSDYYYYSQFTFQDDYNNCIFIGDSDTPVTEITIPETTQKIADYAFRGTGIHTVHFEGTNPPALAYTRSFPEWTMLAVPEEAYETYLATDVYKNIPLRITIDGHLDQDVEVEAVNGTSNLLEKIGEDEVKYVVNLKVSGTINSYDMLIIRNQMTSLRNLDLTDASIVDCDYIYSNANGTNYHSQKDVITGDWLNNVMNIKLPANTKTIGYRAFYNNSRLQAVNIPDGVTSIGSEAFWACI